MIITQNVDDLHERAGSQHVMHLHGELFKVRSTGDPDLIYDWKKDLNIGDNCELDTN
ncbi:MAG: Sir2 family NAD-dependent protein deacetylase [Saprospiraceae bacterium]